MNHRAGLPWLQMAVASLEPRTSPEPVYQSLLVACGARRRKKEVCWFDLQSFAFDGGYYEFQGPRRLVGPRNPVSPFNPHNP